MSSDDVRLKATYEFWYGNTLWHRQQLREAEKHLLNALELAGPPLGDENLMALANAELAYTYSDLAQLEKAKQHADEACRLATICREDYFVWQAAFGSQGYLGWAIGEPQRASARGAQPAGARGPVRQHPLSRVRVLGDGAGEPRGR